MGLTVVNILIVHAAILVVVFAAKLLRRDVSMVRLIGIYFILLPIGVRFLSPLPTAAIAVGALVGVFWLLVPLKEKPGHPRG